MRSVFLLGYTQDPKKGVAGGALGGGQEAETYTPQKIMKYINSGVTNIIAGISKMRSVFLLGYPQTPKRALLGELGGEGGLRPILHKR